jgi:hypothetical protein
MSFLSKHKKLEDLFKRKPQELRRILRRILAIKELRIKNFKVRLVFSSKRKHNFNKIYWVSKEESGSSNYPLERTQSENYIIEINKST